MSSIDLYAVLGVARDASTDEIRAAWKAAVADLDPTDPTLNVFNQAGAVLLDDKRRAAYDEELAAGEVEADEVKVVRPAPTTPPSTPATSRPARPAPAVASPTTVTPQEAAGERPRREVPVWVLAGLAVLTVAAVLAAIFAAGPIGRALPDRGVPEEHARIAAAVESAERAAIPVLSYDYRTLDSDKKAATDALGPSFTKEFDRFWDAIIEPNAPANKSVVKTKVVASAVRQTNGEDRVDVFLFVNRSETDKTSAEPTVYRDQVTFSMRLVDGEWLVDDMQTTRPA